MTPLQQLQTVLDSMPAEPDDDKDPRMAYLARLNEEANILDTTPEKVRELHLAAARKAAGVADSPK